MAAPGWVGELGLITRPPCWAMIVAEGRLLRMDAEDFGDAGTLSGSSSALAPAGVGVGRTAQPIARLRCRSAGDEAG